MLPLTFQVQLLSNTSSSAESRSRPVTAPLLVMAVAPPVASIAIDPKRPSVLAMVVRMSPRMVIVPPLAWARMACVPPVTDAPGPFEIRMLPLPVALASMPLTPPVTTPLVALEIEVLPFWAIVSMPISLVPVIRALSLPTTVTVPAPVVRALMPRSSPAILPSTSMRIAPPAAVCAKSDIASMPTLGTGGNSVGPFAVTLPMPVMLISAESVWP